MDYRLTDEGIALLKELNCAGNRGQMLPQPRFALARLLRAGYVKQQVIKASADRYVITATGAVALSNATPLAVTMPAASRSPARTRRQDRGKDATHSDNR